jgi:hypothetical protein
MMIEQAFSCLRSADDIAQANVHEHVAANQTSIICVTVFHLNQHGVTLSGLQKGEWQHGTYVLRHRARKVFCSATKLAL